MNCNEIMDLMQASLDHELMPHEKQTLDTHLVTCSDCAHLYTRLKLLSQELAQLPKVKPAYSIVDAILPQLEDLPAAGMPAVAMNETSSAVENDEISEDAGAVPIRKKRGILSWTMYTGVIAAGLALGIFIINELPGMSGGQSANSIAQTHSDQGNMTTDELVEESDGGTYKVSADSLYGLENYSSKGETGSDEEGAIVMGGSQQADEASEESETAPPQSAAITMTSRGTGTDAETPPSQSSAAATPPTEIHREREVGVLKHENDGNQEPDFNVADSFEDAGMQQTSEEVPDYGAMFMQPVVSPDEEKAAHLLQDYVNIIAEDGSVVFTSEAKIEPGDIITFIGWIDTDVFQYSIISAAGEEAIYEIWVEDQVEISP